MLSPLAGPGTGVVMSKMKQDGASVGVSVGPAGRGWKGTADTGRGLGLRMTGAGVGVRSTGSAWRVVELIVDRTVISMPSRMRGNCSPVRAGSCEKFVSGSGEKVGRRESSLSNVWGSSVPTDVCWGLFDSPISVEVCKTSLSGKTEGSESNVVWETSSDEGSSPSLSDVSSSS